MFRISSMIGSLKCPYPGLSTDLTSDILTQIQTSIRQKVDIWSRDKPPPTCLTLAINKDLLSLKAFCFICWVNSPANPIKFASA